MSINNEENRKGTSSRSRARLVEEAERRDEIKKVGHFYLHPKASIRFGVHFIKLTVKKNEVKSRIRG